MLSSETDTAAYDFQNAHGPGVSALGFRVDNAQLAFDEALRRGATAAPSGALTLDVPAIVGIGGSLIYFIEPRGETSLLDFAYSDVVAAEGAGKGLLTVEHLTNNVEKGTLGHWSNFYRDVFGFTEVRKFDIRGEQTGLLSYALRSPDGSFCIPINEGTEEKSQIEEYLREYKGPGIQQIAFLATDLLSSLDQMKGGPVEFLDIDDQYYETVFDRVPDVMEDHAKIQELQVLVDGDPEGYLLQIFTRNLCGPTFIELIQRKNQLSFGEGNFGALFRSIERDQERRGVLEDLRVESDALTVGVHGSCRRARLEILHRSSIVHESLHTNCVWLLADALGVRARPIACGRVEGAIAIKLALPAVAVVHALVFHRVAVIGDDPGVATAVA
ncbi:MAG: 4-hydroxyphenylpyruvate dioxygenase [Bradymonadia bacterium]